MSLARTTWITAIAVTSTALTAFPARPQTADAPAPSFVSLKFEGSCDAQNNRLWLASTHTFKTIGVKIRWRAAGGKDLIEDFFPGPNSVREIGCAAEAEILEANFADF
ncbi:hypothetical protein [Povalibacter sp.]|uniref:hypothetical protein n=1 Tax=Povalibacter sp. TaxID=1962978 RepID=UPI002F3FFF01